MTPRLAAKLIALKRRFALFRTGQFDPHPIVPDSLCLSPSQAHVIGYDEADLALAWDRAGITDPHRWQLSARQKLAELVGYQREGGAGPTVSFDQDVSVGEGLDARRYYLQVSKHRDVPVTLVWERSHYPPSRVMLCLHGHNSGAHLSWGEQRMPEDPLKIAAGADYALQAAKYGFLAVCIEQACFGERSEQKMAKRSPHPCFDAAHNALMLGRTLLGERVADVSAVIDWLLGDLAEHEIDPQQIYAMGNSAGGDTTVFAAALDLRISGIMAGGCVGRFRTTTGRREACADIIVPGILKWLEYDDVIGLCAPRPVVAVSGTQDHIYPFSEVAETIECARAVYTMMGAPSQLRVLAGDGGHRFYPDVAWPALLDIVGSTQARV
jgi:hypothetical protein